ncbi:MAG: protease modulator HflC [Methylococcaceae bacterium]|nr:protease modulator HflC [Methylococcaceae bacterium]
MTQYRLPIILAVLTVGFLSTVFMVHQTEKAILFEFGKIVKSDYEPGLHFKIPIWNNVKFFDSRILNLDAKPERFLTSEKKNVIVDSFVKWRIDNVSLFYTTMGGDPNTANLRVDQIMKDAMRSEFSKRTINQVVSADRSDLRDILVKDTSGAAEKWGIRIVDIRIKRIDLPSDVSSSVYLRMVAERDRIAKEFRSEGAEAAERIRANADKQREIILAEAFREAETNRGEGDAIATDIYARAYGKDAEFFRFYRSLNAYKNVFSKGGDMLVLEPSSDFFKYFGKEQ